MLAAIDAKIVSRQQRKHSQVAGIALCASARKYPEMSKAYTV